MISLRWFSHQLPAFKTEIDTPPSGTFVHDSHRIGKRNNYQLKSAFFWGDMLVTRRVCRCFLKWWYPTTMVFPTKNDHFWVFWGYHHLRKPPYLRKDQVIQIVWVGWVNLTMCSFSMDFQAVPASWNFLKQLKNWSLFFSQSGASRNRKLLHIRAYSSKREQENHLQCFFLRGYWLRIPGGVKAKGLV